MAIGPFGFNPNSAKSTTYLTWMYQHQFILFSKSPQEVTSYSTLFKPYGPVLWVLIFVTVGLLTMALVIVTALSTNEVNLIGKINIIKIRD